MRHPRLARLPSNIRLHRFPPRRPPPPPLRSSVVPNVPLASLPALTTTKHHKVRTQRRPHESKYKRFIANIKRTVLPKLYKAKAILLDWDGTLLNSYAADSSAYIQMFRKLGINWGRSELEKHYSPNWHKVYRAARVPKHKWKEADHLWYQAYKKESPKLLPGARATIKLLSNSFILGVVTSGKRKRVIKQLQDFRLEKYFAVQICAEDATHRKPHPAPLKLALKHLNLSPESCIYVGDTAEDIEMARRAKVRALGVYGPFPTAARMRDAKPDVMLRSIADLPNRIAPLVL